jgi:hypothetical protein
MQACRAPRAAGAAAGATAAPHRPPRAEWAARARRSWRILSRARGATAWSCSAPACSARAPCACCWVRLRWLARPRGASAPPACRLACSQTAGAAAAVGLVACSACKRCGPAEGAHRRLCRMGGVTALAAQLRMHRQLQLPTWLQGAPVGPFSACDRTTGVLTDPIVVCRLAVKGG